MSVEPLVLWAKRAGARDDAPAAFHPLLCHMLDVGAVAEQLWALCLPPSARDWFANQIGIMDVANAGRWAVFLSALHDLGKASPAFQTREQLANPARHGTISTHLLDSALQAPPFGLERSIARRLATVVGGHHGAFPRAADLKPVRDDKDQAGRRRWKDHQRWLLHETARLLEIEAIPPPPRLTNAGAAWLAGFVSVADWIGSNQDFFPYAAADGQIPADFSIDDYVELARERAAQAITELGWAAWPSQGEPRVFTDLFAFPPNALQEEVISLVEELHEPYLAIIEAPMGMGKTEAALYLADHANVTLGMRGHYLALPTQATSNQMFARDTAFLERRYTGQPVNTQLLHGHAALSSDFRALQQKQKRYLHEIDIPNDQNRGADGAMPGVIAAEWFTARKRGLLAPFGVGTIDQALLAVLQTRHFFVRLLGLAGKTIVLDEVHAYDTYMSVLLERLLCWLSALGCSVVLLSATLPAARRERLLQAWSGATPTADSTNSGNQTTTYPAITWRSGARGGTAPFPAPAKRVHVRWLTADAEGDYPNLGLALQNALCDGGCAAVICNTVKRAQETYTALRAHFSAEELSLFHARFPYKERMRREQAALRLFGKPGDTTARPHRAVIVATQVIEQSLDLDFDLMVTDLAPADLVLQRSGRLHRHDRDRPPGLKRAALWLLAPAEREGLPVFPRRDLYVYDEHILLRSWLALRNLQQITIPDDVVPLIEAVYDDGAVCPSNASHALHALWDETWTQLEQKRQSHESMARTVAVYPPGERESGFLEQRNRVLEEDDPGTHDTLRALTRLGEANITAICLPPDKAARLQPAASDVGQRAAELLQCSVSLSHRGVVQALVAQNPPASWKTTALLRHCRLVLLDVQGNARIGDYQLHVHPDLGIVVNRAGSPEE